MEKQDTEQTTTQSSNIGYALRGGTVLAMSSLASFFLITRILGRTHFVSRDDDLLGGMWAVAATVFVVRYSYEQSVSAALSRMAATSLSFALCLVYLLIFPFHSWGMAALIGINAIILTLMGRSDDIITAGITTAVIMIVAAISPHAAWKEPVLRVIDTAVGIAVGVAAVRINLGVTRSRRSRLEPEPTR
jgi:uncharacterized membrane protein YccC